MDAHDTEFVDVMLGRPIAWPKKAHTWEDAARHAEIVYEDDAVIAFHDVDEEQTEPSPAPGEIRVTLLSKSSAKSLLHLGANDHATNAAMLHGIQQVAFRLGLNVTGFEVRAHVMPPLQHRPQLAFQIRSGKPPSKSGSGE